MEESGEQRETFFVGAYTLLASCRNLAHDLWGVGLMTRLPAPRRVGIRMDGSRA
jgi:hypothetical protein